MRSLVLLLALVSCAFAFRDSIDHIARLHTKATLRFKAKIAAAQKQSLQSDVTTCGVLTPVCGDLNDPCTEDLDLENPWNLCSQDRECKNVSGGWFCQDRVNPAGRTCTSNGDCEYDGGIDLNSSLYEFVCYNGQCVEKSSIVPPPHCRANGDQCSQDVDCVMGATCSGGKCVGKPRGETCEYPIGQDCANGLYCQMQYVAGVPVGGTCQPYQNNGDASETINFGGSSMNLGWISCKSQYFTLGGNNPCAPKPVFYSKSLGQSCNSDLDDGLIYPFPGFTECKQGLFCNSTTKTCQRLKTSGGEDVIDGGACTLHGGDPQDNDCPSYDGEGYLSSQLICMCTTPTSSTPVCQWTMDDSIARVFTETFVTGGSARCPFSMDNGTLGCMYSQAYADADLAPADYMGACVHSGRMCMQAKFVSGTFNSLLSKLAAGYVPNTPVVCGVDLTATYDPSPYCSGAATAGVSVLALLLAAAAFFVRA